MKDQWTFKLIGGAILAGLMGIHPLFWALMALMVLDFLTGLLAAFITKTVQSDISRRGVAKKAMCIILVAASEILGHNLRYLVPGVFSSELPLGQLVAGFYCIHELISITENAALAGLPMPKFLTGVLGKLKNAMEQSALDNSVTSKATAPKL